jgi:hypothetical protein
MSRSTYPLFEVLDDRTNEPVSVVVWNVRAIFPAIVKGREVTRIEYTNGDILDSSDTPTFVLMRFQEAAEPRQRARGRKR